MRPIGREGGDGSGQRGRSLISADCLARRVQEMKELAALAYRDTTAENREFWKNEMGQALREIQQVYDDKLESMRSEMETFYNLKVAKRSSSSVSILLSRDACA